MENENQVPDAQLQGNLIAAIKDQNTGDVERLLNRGAMVNTVDDDGDTPLHVAVRDGNPEIVSALITRGADLNAMNNEAETPVGLAAGKESDMVLRELVRAGANIDIADDDGKTHLHEYADSGNLSAVTKLLDVGANPNLQDTDLETPLGKAVDMDHGDVAIVLLNRGADPNVHPPQGMSVFSTAVLNENLEVAIELLNRGANSEIHNDAMALYLEGDGDMAVLETVRAHRKDISAGRTLKMLSNKLTLQQTNGDDSVAKNTKVLDSVLEHGFGQRKEDAQFSLDNFAKAMNSAKDARRNRQSDRVNERRANEQQSETPRTRRRLA